MAVKNKSAAEQALQANRRQNLRNLVDTWDGPLALAKQLGYANASFIVTMAGPNPTRAVSEATSRMIEEKLDLGPGFMDRKPSAVQAPVMNTDLLHECVRVVTEACEEAKLRFTPHKFADLVTLVYSEAVANQGNIKVEQLKKIIQFAS